VLQPEELLVVVQLQPEDSLVAVQLQLVVVAVLPPLLRSQLRQLLQPAHEQRLILYHA
jgi:hypothetical protein